MGGPSDPPLQVRGLTRAPTGVWATLVPTGGGVYNLLPEISKAKHGRDKHITDEVTNGVKRVFALCPYTEVLLSHMNFIGINRRQDDILHFGSFFYVKIKKKLFF